MSIKEGEEKLFSEATETKKELTEQEMIQLRKAQQKNAVMELANYKKRLKESVEISELQVQELKYKIEYYQLKEQWFNLQDDIRKLEEKEAKLIAEQQQQIQAAKSQNKPNIILPKQGKSRLK
jgi:hypothetical protein